MPRGCGRSSVPVRDVMCACWQKLLYWAMEPQRKVPNDRTWPVKAAPLRPSRGGRKEPWQQRHWQRIGSNKGDDPRCPEALRYRGAGRSGAASSPVVLLSAESDAVQPRHSFRQPELAPVLRGCRRFAVTFRVLTLQGRVSLLEC